MPNKARYAASWIQPIRRKQHQRVLTDDFHNRIGCYAASPIRPLPKLVLFHALESAVLGHPLRRIDQFAGSSVGIMADLAYRQAQVATEFLEARGREIKAAFPFSTHGAARELAGIGKGPPYSSFVAAQDQATRLIGTLPWDHDLVPKPALQDGLYHYGLKTEQTWGHPSSWPVSWEKVVEASRPPWQSISRLMSADLVAQILAQGYGVLACSAFGTASATSRHGLRIAQFDDKWHDAVVISGFWRHPDAGLVFFVDTARSRGALECPFLSRFGVKGSFSIYAAQLDLICHTGEVYGYSDQQGFPVRSIPWDQFL